MGEAIHLSHAERKTLIQTARRTLDDAGYTDVPIIAGTGAGSTRETIELCHEAAEAGADYAITIASGYFAGALKPAALKEFFTEVAEKSPLPVIIYNCESCVLLESSPKAGGANATLQSPLPAAASISTPTLSPNSPRSALTCVASSSRTSCDSPVFPSILLTLPRHRCGNVGKLTRICATVSEPSFAAAHPRKNPNAPFLVLGGFADFILPSTYMNAHGAIIGLANVAPVSTYFVMCIRACRVCWAH